MACDSVVSFVRRVSVMVFTALLFLPTLAFAQSPWERAASNLERTFTGPLARSLALVAIVIGGLLFMFGEAGANAASPASFSAADSRSSRRSSSSGCSETSVRFAEVRACLIARRTGPCSRRCIAP